MAPATVTRSPQLFLALSGSRESERENKRREDIPEKLQFMQEGGCNSMGMAT